MADPVVNEKEGKENFEMTTEQEDEKAKSNCDAADVEEEEEEDPSSSSDNSKKRPAETQDADREVEEEIEEEEELGGGGSGSSRKDGEKDEGTSTQEQKEEESEEDEASVHSATKAGEIGEAAETTAPIDITKRPVKRARTAYFVFCDDKRAEMKEKLPGQGVAAVARALGQLWSSMSEDDKKSYYETAATERERVQADLAAWKAAGGVEPDDSIANKADSNALTFPVARIRKICKLDPEVRGLSKESVLLITKAAELATAKLAGECVKTAAIQNRRKLLPDDVAAVCSNREQFLFLAADIQDLHKQQKNAAVAAKSAKAKSSTNSNINESSAAAAAATGAKPLTDYFSSKAKT